MTNKESSQMKIGLIGLGIMGKPMAKNLLKAGYELKVNDLNKAAVDEVCACGATAAKDIPSLAKECDVILTMLPNSPQVKQVLLGKGGVCEGIRSGSIVADMSSINPMATREIAAELEKLGVEMVDAPVSGGEPKAVDGTLSFMVGGKQEVFDQMKPILEKMGASVVLCGGIGAGNVTKLCNQIIVAVNIAALSEAFTLGQKAGVSCEAIYEAIRGGLAGSTVMNAKGPMMMDRNFKPGFKIDLHIKDLNNVLDTAKSVDAPVFLTTQVMEMMKVLHHDGEGQSDHSALVKFYEKLTGETIV
ncbi:MAG: 2-hydroxy-3-oxopropionate reductase, partial [Clostridia bacterium]